LRYNCRSCELVRNELYNLHFAIYLNHDRFYNINDSFRSTCVGDDDGQGFYPRHRQQKRKATFIPRASGMWYVYKCVCSTWSRTKSSFNPYDARTIAIYTYQGHYNKLLSWITVIQKIEFSG